MDSPTRSYRLAPLRSLAHTVVGWLPPSWREPISERLLRRAASPGPAAEHVFQYQLSRRGGGDEANVAAGADQFYERQYRQFLSPAMGAFAQTATQVVIGTGGQPRGWLWNRHRRSVAAVVEQRGEAPPLLVLNPETVAVALMLPRPKRAGEADEASRWLSGAGPMPTYFRELIEGTEIGGGTPGIRMREASAAGALLATLEAILTSRRLAALATHPHDPDAMGLHLTLFGVEVIAPDELLTRFGLDRSVIAAYRYDARRADRALVFCVGATEEVFTQCSQNLFVKRAAPPGRRKHQRDPLPPLEDFVGHQFEALQVTVSASGLPGASPRNGAMGRTVFATRKGRKLLLLIPYHPGSAIHGHAAKLWSNPYGTVILSDDHDSLCRITVSGPAWVISHSTATKRYPDSVARVSAQRGHNGKPVAEPEYWFVQEVAELCRQREPLMANDLDLARPTSSISAGGEALHGEKPAYFGASELPPYDMALQRQREATGLEDDPTGACYSLWQAELEAALQARLEHLDQVLQRPFRWDHTNAGELRPPTPPTFVSVTATEISPP
ncbi:MAG: hypothetical protein FIA97_13070 [Methylococcaceae bacterium]|nr:hypothetical protein [Methylococcaceae bacterium]